MNHTYKVVNLQLDYHTNTNFKQKIFISTQNRNKNKNLDQTIRNSLINLINQLHLDYINK